MKCTTCGANLPPGAASCPLCATPTPYNVAGSGSSPQYDPTVISPQPQYGGSPYGSGGQPPIDPTVATPSYGGTPPTAYGTPSYGAPPPPGQNPYESAPANPYNASTEPQYGMPSGQPGAYGTPPMQQGQVQPVPPWQQVPGPGGYGYSPPPKRRSRVGLIVAIVLAVVLLACVGISVLIYQVTKTGIDTVTATVTAAVSTETSIPTTGSTSTTGTSPSGQSVDPGAAAIITNLQMASMVDTNTAVATKLATTFNTQQTVYATVSLNMGGQTGYAEAKWYGNGSLIRTSIVLNINSASDTNAYFFFSYNTATQGAVEIYWCTQSDCSDAKLATSTTFTVSTTSLHWQNQPPMAFSDINRP